MKENTILDYLNLGTIFDIPIVRDHVQCLYDLINDEFKKNNYPDYVVHVSDCTLIYLINSACFYKTITIPEKYKQRTLAASWAFVEFAKHLENYYLESFSKELITRDQIIKIELIRGYIDEFKEVLSEFLKDASLDMTYPVVKLKTGKIIIPFQK